VNYTVKPVSGGGSVFSRPFWIALVILGVILFVALVIVLFKKFGKKDDLFEKHEILLTTKM
jgi:hypothetical protein